MGHPLKMGSSISWTLIWKTTENHDFRTAPLSQSVDSMCTQLHTFYAPDQRNSNSYTLLRFAKLEIATVTHFSTSQ